MVCTVFSNDNELIRFYTGFPTYMMLISFFNVLSPSALNMVRWTQICRQRSNLSKKLYKSFNQKLLLIDQLFMILQKVRLGTLDQDVAEKDAKQSEPFHMLLRSFNLIQHVDVATHQCGHTLDLVITHDDDDLLLSVTVTPDSLSDHQTNGC